MTTKATRGKLERALDALDSFRNADNIESVLTPTDRKELLVAVATIALIESRLYNEEG